MRTVIAFALSSFISASAMAASISHDVETIVSCKTTEGNELNITWNRTSGDVVLDHGNYHGTKNTNNMGWSKMKSSEAEDTEIYMDNGDVHNVISVTDTGDSKYVGFKQTIGDDMSNVWTIDQCADNYTLNLSDAFLEKMTYVDDE